jgi:transposase InsO family protein
VVDRLVETVVLGYEFMQQHQVCIDIRRQCMYFGTDDRSTVFFKTGSSNTTGDNRLQSLRKGLTSITAPASPLAERAEKNFPEELRPKIHRLLDEFKSLFDMEDTSTTTTTTKHHIRLKDATPFRLRPYRYSDEKKKIIQEQVEKMLVSGVIEPSTSEYASPVVIVKKKDGQPRFCVDYRRLNAATRDEAAPLPIIQEMLRDLGQAKVFTSLDLKSGYWQVPLSDESKEYTAFTTPDGGLYQFRVMPFGLKGAPPTFQRLMSQEVLTGHLRNFTMVYLDDIIVYSTNHEEHIKHLQLVFERLQIHGLRCAPEKCHLGEREIVYLGHVVSTQGNQPQQLHLRQIQEAPTPKDRRSLRSFLGLCNWLRDYVPRFADIAYPLTDLLSAKKPWRWGPTEEEAFRSVKKVLAQPLMLHRPNPKLPYVLQTDASGTGMAAVLYQEDGGRRRIISYSSARFNPTEMKYHSNEQECLAVVWAIRRYRPYIEDKPFLLRTDNKALTWLQTTKNERAKLLRWALELQSYQFTIEHCPGKENQLPDMLSRDPNARESHEEDVEDVERLLPRACPAALHTLAEEVRRAQVEDGEVTAKVVEALRDPAKSAESWVQRFRYGYFEEDGQLFYGPERKLFVPTDVRQRVLFSYHDEALAGHPGAEETERSIAQHFHWPKLQESVRRYVRRCLLCAQYKCGSSQPAAPQKPRQPKRPFEAIACDLMGPYPRTPSGNRFILVVTDLFSRWVEGFAIPTSTTSVIVRLLEEEVFTRQGYPGAIITDNGSQFTSRRWTRACRHWQTRTWTTAPYTPRENPTERRNQELKKALRFRLVGRGQNTWDSELSTALFSVRRRRNAATGMSPSQLLYGRDLAYPGAWDAPGDNEPLTPASEPLIEAQRHQELYIQRRFRDEDAAIVTFQPGDLVMLRVPAVTPFRPFNCKWTGPHQVIRRIGQSHVYVVKIGEARAKHHVDRLRAAPPSV